jgi:hypothetical protein
MERKMDNLNEAMARRAADLETINNRINTLKTHYDELYMKLDTVMKVHPDYFEKNFAMVPLADIKQNNSSKDELVNRAWYLNEMSKAFVKQVNQYEYIKDNHPELFK